MGHIVINEQKNRDVHYFPCVTCGNNHIKFVDCGYSSFNIAWGKCHVCGFDITLNGVDADNIEKVVEAWNTANNPRLLREKYAKQIEELQILIDKLPEYPEGIYELIKNNSK